MEQVQRELPPRIDRMLNSDPSKLRVWAQLSYWRIRYRLAALRLTEAGETARFSATVNPTFPVGSGVSVHISDADLLRIVFEVADEVLRSDGVIATARRGLRNEALAQGGDSPELNARRARGLFGFASYMRSGRPPPPSPVIQVGDTAGGGIIAARMRRLARQRDPNRIVTSPAPGFQPPIPYLGPGSFSRRLPSGSGSTATGRGLRNILTGADVQPGQGDPALLGEFAATLYSQELGRRPENLAMSAMFHDLVERGPRRGGVGLTAGLQTHPATMQGARAAQAELRAAVARGGPLRGSSEMQEARRRSVEMVRLWVRAQLAAGNGPITKTRLAFMRWLRRTIRERLRTLVRTGA